MTRTPEQIAALRREIAAIPSWYHVIDLGDGVRTPGALDNAPYLRFHPFPERMDGLRVLDVGSSNGFFSFEFERRGAEVVALDLSSWLDHDWSDRYRAQAAGYSADEKRKFDDLQMRAGFDLAARALASKVVKRELRIYDVSAEELGLFDLVFSGAMLMHVRDPVLGMQCLRRVCAPEGRLVVSVSTCATEQEDALARFRGEWDQCNFWQMNPACVRRVLAFCDFEPTGVEFLYDAADVSGTFRDPIFVCEARPRKGA